VRVSSVDEDAAVAAAEAMSGPLEAPDVALLLARAKAEDIVSTIEADETGDTDGADETDDLPDDLLVLGCDSVLELDGEVHGKPADAAEAVERWRRMRGRTGTLHTGHWLVDARHADDGGTGGMVGGTASTVVHFADLDDDEVEAYIATGEPLAVAGAFTIDGLGGQTGGTSRRLVAKCRSRRAAYVQPASSSSRSSSASMTWSRTRSAASRSRSTSSSYSAAPGGDERVARRTPSVASISAILLA
jgi:predicted house-cleaning NTP pyrophosphatase (Maf/HAM1 superfamily)